MVTLNFSGQAPTQETVAMLVSSVRTLWAWVSMGSATQSAPTSMQRWYNACRKEQFCGYADMLFPPLLELFFRRSNNNSTLTNISIRVNSYLSKIRHQHLGFAHFYPRIFEVLLSCFPPTSHSFRGAGSSTRKSLNAPPWRDCVVIVARNRKGRTSSPLRGCVVELCKLLFVRLVSFCPSCKGEV